MAIFVNLISLIFIAAMSQANPIHNCRHELCNVTDIQPLIQTFVGNKVSEAELHFKGFNQSMHIESYVLKVHKINSDYNCDISEELKDIKLSIKNVVHIRKRKFNEYTITFSSIDISGTSRIGDFHFEIKNMEMILKLNDNKVELGPRIKFHGEPNVYEPSQDSLDEIYTCISDIPQYCNQKTSEFIEEHLMGKFQTLFIDPLVHHGRHHH